MKKKLKSFFTLKHKANDGFTLVELIVVIAILAILGGVAVPAYSGYVTKANKQADLSTIRDVRQALELHFYSNPNEVVTEYVKLGNSGVIAVDENSHGAEAMEAVYGANWQTAASLKYEGWEGDTAAANYAETSYYGNEQSLLNKVDGLTDALGMAVEGGLKLGNFETFLEGYDLKDSTDSTAISNAAVLYVAQQTANNQEFIKTTIAEKSATSDKFINDTFNALSPTIGDAAALAAIYAYAEGFAQYCDEKDGTTAATDAFVVDFAVQDGQTMDATLALQRMETAFNNLGTVGADHITDYMAAGGPGVTDVTGYVGMMGTVNNNKNIVDGNLGADDCFTDGTVEKVLQGYANVGSMKITTERGQVAVALTVVDGVPSIHYLPLELNQ